MGPKGKPTFCMVYAPGESAWEQTPTGLAKRTCTEYEIWIGNGITAGTRVCTSKYKRWANRIGLGLATSMKLTWREAR
jgi:hypothetical protein